MNLDLSRIEDIPASDLMKLAKRAMAFAAMGGIQYTSDGVNFQRMTMEQAQKLYEFASQLAADESIDGSNGLALVQWGERR